MMKVKMLKITVKLYPPQFSRKQVTYNQRGNYKGNVLGGVKEKENTRKTSPGEQPCIDISVAGTVDKPVSACVGKDK